MRKRTFGLVLAGLAAGTVTGLFGGGGGMVLVPLLTLLTSFREDSVFPTSISIILPVCLVSLVLTAQRQELAFREALPYLLGSLLGGFGAGKWGQRIPVIWLHKALGILILWGGFRYLC